MRSAPFGTLPTGEMVDVYTLGDPSILEMKVIPFGGIVVSLRVPDRKGNPADVVLGFDHLEPYLSSPSHSYIGALIGRVAGRISNAKFTLDGHAYTLAANNPPNHLHGGITGFDRRLWTVEPLLTADGSDVLRLTYRSPDGEEGYPGNLDVAVTYTVTRDGDWIMETTAVTDKATPFNPTHHAYFNLAGEGTGTMEGHHLQVFADEMIPTDEQFRLSGRIEAVDPANDFRTPREIGKALPEIFQQHGGYYRLPRAGFGEYRIAAKVFEPQSGRTLTVGTTADYLQFYSAYHLDGTLTGKAGNPYGPFAGFCLECEGYSDGANHPELGDIILSPGERFHQRTVYSFSNK